MNYANEIDSLIQGVSLAIGKPIPREKYEILDRGLPHTQPTRLPFGKMAVYMFLFNSEFLKIGKANHRSNARFCSHHYSLSAPSTLAKSLLADDERLSLSHKKLKEDNSMKKGLTELVFILDKSGSMSGLEKDTIGGYNSMLAKQKNVQGDCHITTVLFDNNYELLHDRIDIRAVSPITEKEYQVGGSTALLDAIGSTIHKIGNAQKHTAEEYRAENVMFVIITDGEENSSREYSAEKVKSQIERQKSKYNWEFIFLGANIDAVHTAKQFGIGEDRAMDYIADSEGTALNYSVMSDVVSEFREKTTISDKHFDEIRKDAKKRGGQR